MLVADQLAISTATPRPVSEIAILPRICILDARIASVDAGVDIFETVENFVARPGQSSNAERPKCQSIVHRIV